MKVIKLGIVALFFIVSLKFVLSGEKSRFEKLELFNRVLFLVESQYYRKVDTEKLIQGAIRGMMNTLDPHSAYLDEEIFSKMKEDTQGEFGGLGIEVTQKDGVLIITSAIEDTPAHKAGVKMGDKIVEINHDSMIGVTLEEAVQKMRGRPGTKILMGVLRNGTDGIKRIPITRRIIKINSVKSFIVQKDFIYLRLLQFQKNSAKNLVKAIKKFRKKLAKTGGPKGVVLDLRNNPGGLLEEAVDISSVFLKEGIIVSTGPRNAKEKEIKYVKKGGHKELTIPLIVLVNGSSASASEIVAGALQDHKRGVIMGSQTFGKGSVQTVVKIDEEKGIKLTIAQYMTPLDRKIQAVGIVPDIRLDEYESDWAMENKISRRYVREADLRNHLTATIETPVEKKMREKKEKEDRVRRIKENEAKKKNEKKDELKELVKKYNPENDYQVIQAINYLRSFSVWKKIK